MRPVSELLKGCSLKFCLLTALSGVPRRYFRKMLETYYSFYCALTELWYGDDVADCVLADFRQDGFKDGKENYYFYCRGLSKETDCVGTIRIDWNQVLDGKLRVYIPECIDRRLGSIDEAVLCAMILYQANKCCKSEIQKHVNRNLFDAIKYVHTEECCQISNYEQLLESELHYLMDKHGVDNAILEFKELQGTSFKWGDLLQSLDVTFPRKYIHTPMGLSYLMDAMKYGRLPGVYRRYYRLDDDNPPDLRRLYTTLEAFESAYKDLDSEDYIEVSKKSERIIIEKNRCYKKRPLIYVRDGAGERIGIVEFKLSELLCMEIRVPDGDITSSEQVLALIAFYWEYPIRVERIQREYFVQSLIGMKAMSLAETADRS